VNPSAQERGSVGLRRELTFLDSTMINVGTIIASGIFFVPATVAAHVEYSGLILLAWVVAGIVSLLGAFSIAELGAAMPEAGGIYVYLREAYGPVWGFLYGWTAFAVTNTASISAIAVGFAAYLAFFLPLTGAATKVVAMGSVLALTTLNCYGLKLGAWTQNVLSISKLLAFAGLLVCTIFLPGGSAHNFIPVFPEELTSAVIGPFGLALVATLWAYDGWIEVTFVGGEVRDPARVIPRSILTSVVVVALVYVAVNAAYIYVLSASSIEASTLVAADAGTALVGPLGAALIAGAVILSTLGSNNGIVFTAARIPYAMAREREFFRALATVHPRFHTPHTALLVQGAWACTLILTGTYDQLITYVVFASFIFYALAAGATIVLRKKRPDMRRPYRTWGYPLTPALFDLFALWLVANTILEDPRDAVVGAGIILLGLPAYFVWKHRRT
jgi:APA family basic amino acid/polyamine antiporter